MSSQNKKRSKFTYGFASYGVKIGITAFSREFITAVRREVGKNLPLNPSEIEFEETVHKFEVEYINGEYSVSEDGEELSALSEIEPTLGFLEKRVFITIAGNAESRVFIHAGAVSYRDMGIIFPARSYGGKSTLTAEFVKAGATYYSDDCAVIDENGLLHPFPKQLSIREVKDKIFQTDYPIEHFGGRAGVKPVEVKLIVLTEYEQGFNWSPQHQSPGKSLLEILEHTVPIRFKPEFTLAVLHKLVNRAIITKSKRGDAETLVAALLKALDSIDYNSPESKFR